MSDARSGGALPAQASIDGRRIEVLEGETILDAARRSGIEIPTLCNAPGLPAEGGCRLCLVEIEGLERPRAACHTVLSAGMRVHAHSDRIEALRRDILALSLAAVPDAPRALAGLPGGRASGQLHALAEAIAPQTSPLFEPQESGASRHAQAASPSPVQAVVDAHPYLRFDPSLCIDCRRCMHACASWQGQFVYGVAGRGAEVRLIVGADDTFAGSPCVACGACVDVCPSGALFDRDRAAHLPTNGATKTTDTVCGYCGVGCRVRVVAEGGRVRRISGVPEAAVNFGHLCAKGRFAHGWHAHPERLTTPLIREGGDFRPISWPDAIAFAARRLKEIHDTHGSDALGAITSSRSTNEAAYLLQKLFRTQLASNHIDCRAQVCHSSTELSMALVTGAGVASASFADVDRARCIVIAGANPTEAHPVIGARIKQAVLAGAKLIVIDPRRIELAEIADVHLALRPGSNVALFNALAAALLEAGLVDRGAVERHSDGLADLEAFLATRSLASRAADAGIEVAEIRRAAQTIGRHGPPLLVHGLGLSQTSQGTAAVLTFCNLGLLTGALGRVGAGILPLRGQNNVQGNADMGGTPDRVTGYQRLDDAAARARCEQLWGVAPPPHSGLTVTEMLDAAAEGRIRAMWIQGEDVAQSDPREQHTREALAGLDLLIVQEMFFTNTVRHAHLVLPAAGSLEQEGTFTNSERRIQHVRPAVPPPGEARPDWTVARDVANAMGADWDHPTPASVMDEIAQVAPAVFGGLSYAALGPDGIQWPCPDPDRAREEPRQEAKRLPGSGKLVTYDFEPGPESAVAGYPFTLITGRVLHDYNVGSMTRRTPQVELHPADALELCPADADRLGVLDGDPVTITSRWGESSAPAKRSTRVASGMVFLSFHYPETHVNRLVGAHLDPDSRCPDFKAVAVRLHKGD